MNAMLRLAIALALCAPSAGWASTEARRSAMVANIRRELSVFPQTQGKDSFGRALSAVAVVPRERFVPAALSRQAYAEMSPQIGYGQTISDPYFVAIMTAAAEIHPGDSVLEVGTGSGYQAAVLSVLADQVYSIEIVDPLARAASARLQLLGYRKVHVRSGDGFVGWPSAAPFNAILVTAGAAQPPAALLDQLAPNGRLVMPIGPSWAQERLIVFRKSPQGALSRCVLGTALFVPLTGKGQRSALSVGLEEDGIPYCYGADLGRIDFQVVGAARKRR